MGKLESVPPIGAVNALDRFVAMDAAELHTPVKASKTVEKREPQMGALRRILGDVVLDVFPEALRDAVDRAYLIWQANPDSYLPTPFDSEKDRADSLTVMRAYAECAPNGPYTIRVLGDPDPCLLLWRAQTRRGTKADETPDTVPSADGNAEDGLSGSGD